jgi:hypothetical protein
MAVEPALKDGLPKSIRWAKCKGCGKRILFARVKNQKGDLVHVPLDPAPPIYHIAFNEDGTAEAVRGTRNRLMVSHFNTCPKANEFSGSRK